jgi:cytochrome P450
MLWRALSPRRTGKEFPVVPGSWLFPWERCDADYVRMQSALSPARRLAPPAHPLWGHAPAFNRDQLGYLSFLAREYGDVVPLRFTPFRAIFINAPNLIDEVLVVRNRDYRKSLAFRRAGAMLGNGLVLSEGDFWLRQRRLMQPAFHRERIAAYAQIMTGGAEGLVAEWSDGQTHDIQSQMMRLTLGVACRALFGSDVASKAADVGAAFTIALECLQARISSLGILVPDAVPTPTNLRLARAVRGLDKVVYGIIAQRRASGHDPGDLLSLLIQARDAEDGARMSDRQLRDEVMTLLFAGHETTALTLTWSFYLLATHAAAESELHRELDSVLGGRAPTIDDLMDLRFTNAVIAEALRLYPPVWALGREAIVDTAIGDWPVRKRTIVLISPWATHRDARYFSQPDAFQPERWLDGLAHQLPRFAYFPFGGGPRQCIGNTFALTEAALILATLVQCYRLILAAGQTVEPEPTGTLRPRHGLTMRLQARAA